MPYNVELCYGYFEGECGIYHAFRLVAPEKDFPDDVEKSLAESLETKADNPNFKWDCMHLNLPDAIVERIKADGVREYLTAQKGEHQDIQRSVDQQTIMREELTRRSISGCWAMQKLQFQSGSKSEMMKHLASRIYMPGLERNLEASWPLSAMAAWINSSVLRAKGRQFQPMRRRCSMTIWRSEQYERE